MSAQQRTSQDKRELILERAVNAFAAYGFRRCSMEDIAEAAGVSRPALYQHFRNKAEVFRAASERMQTRAIDAAETVAKGKLAERLAAMLILYKAPVWHIQKMTPHGAELLDLNAAVADDVTLAAMERMSDLLAGAIAEEIGAGWDATEAARLLIGATWAVVEHADTEAAFRADIATLASLWAAALTSPRPD
jgi:AcrR family transcriptional regulator